MIATAIYVHGGFFFHSSLVDTGSNAPQNFWAIGLGVGVRWPPTYTRLLAFSSRNELNELDFIARISLNVGVFYRFISFQGLPTISTKSHSHLIAIRYKQLSKFMTGHIIVKKMTSYHHITKICFTLLPYLNSEMRFPKFLYFYQLYKAHELIML